MELINKDKKIYRYSCGKDYFDFLVLSDEKYMELLDYCFSDSDSFGNLMVYLRDNYEGYKVDLVYRDSKPFVMEVLNDYSCVYETPQLFMRYKGNLEGLQSTAKAINTEYEEQYLRIHQDDNHYWTGDKVLKSDKFKTFVICEDEHVVGYCDTTFADDVNEVFDLFVEEKYRNKGYGRSLMIKCLQEVYPRDLILEVDVDNECAKHLYLSLGFVPEGEISGVMHVSL